jgi:hypothetical protein
MRYLKAGGNSQLYDIGIADPQAERHYGELLRLLSHELGPDDLNRPEFKKVLMARPVHEIIDSREASALSNIHVTAMADGRYWWIFYYHDPQRLDHLLITLAPAPRPES